MMDGKEGALSGWLRSILHVLYHSHKFLYLWKNLQDRNLVPPSYYLDFMIVILKSKPFPLLLRISLFKKVRLLYSFHRRMDDTRFNIGPATHISKNPKVKSTSTLNNKRSILRFRTLLHVSLFIYFLSRRWRQRRRPRQRLTIAMIVLAALLRIKVSMPPRCLSYEKSSGDWRTAFVAYRKVGIASKTAATTSLSLSSSPSLFNEIIKFELSPTRLSSPRC